jgi:hypothetical protein
LRASSLAVTDQPVCGGSMNTRSKWSSQVSGLSTTAYGGGGRPASSLTCTRLGPSAPRCSQIDGRARPAVEGEAHRPREAPPCNWYAVVNTRLRLRLGQHWHELGIDPVGQSLVAGQGFTGAACRRLCQGSLDSSALALVGLGNFGGGRLADGVGHGCLPFEVVGGFRLPGPGILQPDK